ncbi:hypothetical protein TPHA_0H01710 [Tetrapisispora phaffii CBS 4417]|uniref:Chromatin modification-related protein EAF1 n=1 Tax=Tetrapisispora phaffii (strain ATCC 24235 / CBS 4417 / NBRC 1672 / NRRL Y-8282 / UCD 70-5) TaxID=1071381 RepID=G8BX73_TETPH|nr:hypothetical protein TPHA_0H01710 [Tetrapisispora phaffii CBS 4417]CCE64377.1 hypothetical protein TPHA_0H01710 [Tetrapisispora phaffii CBS 4417]
MPSDYNSGSTTRNSSNKSLSTAVADVSSEMLSSRTNVTKSSIDNSDSDTPEGQSLNKLLRQRTNNLIELYCISRLHDLLNINDEDKFKEDLKEFLDTNDYNKNGPFNNDNIPNFSQLIPITSLSSATSQSSSSSSSPPYNESITNNNVIVNEKRGKNIRQNKVSNAFKTYKDQSTLIPSTSGDSNAKKRSIDESNNDLIHEQNEEDNYKKTKLQGTTNSSSYVISSTGEIQQTTKIVTNPDDNKIIQNKEKMEGARKRNLYLMSGSSHLQPSSTLDHGIPREYTTVSSVKAEPTPVTITPKSYSNNMLFEMKSKHNESVDFFDKNNINSNESIYLLMKENVPSKIPQALPLAELKYLAHTLPLIKLLPMSHKALTTDIISSALNEGRITVVASRIEELRRLGLWSLRQPKKFIDPWGNQVTHNRVMLEEAKWMYENFKEDKYYKMAMCATVAQAISDYWNYGKRCCVKVQPIQHLPSVRIEKEEIKELSKCDDNTNVAKDEFIKGDHGNDNTITEKDTKENNHRGEINNNESEITDEISRSLEIETKENIIVTPTSINDNLEDAVANEHNKSKLDGIQKEKIQLNEEPESKSLELDLKTTENAPELLSDIDSAVPDIISDESTNTIAIESNPQAIFNPEVELDTLSKGDQDEKEIEEQFTYSPFKLFLQYNELSSLEQTIVQAASPYSGLLESASQLPDQMSFVQISKSLVTLDDDHYFKIVERQLVDEEQSLVQLSKRRGIFYGNRRSHYLKPPAAPSLKYLTSRTPTIWLPEDDEELVKNINAYAYNWELIAAHMFPHPRDSYISNIERRTPWQCFERFVQLNEKFNFNDLKGPKAHMAQQWLIEAHKFQQKQNRRISPLGVGTESIQRGHKRLRWASMFDAIRKCIKKRENSPRPNPTQQRKPLDIKSMKVPTPAEMSNLKLQRDEALRRDIQMRRNVKSRLQQQQQQQQQHQQGQQLQQQQQQQHLQQKQIPLATQQVQTSNSEPLNNFTNNIIPNNSSNVNVVNHISQNSQNFLPQQSNILAEGVKATPQQSMPSSNQVSSAHTTGRKQFTEKEIIETYARKILQQKPEITPEMAIRAAHNYLKNFKQQQLRLHQAQQLQTQTLQNEQANQAMNSGNQGGTGQISVNNMNNLRLSLDSGLSPSSQLKQLSSNMNNNNGFNLPETPNIHLNNGNFTSSSSNNQSMNSPTPQEILQRLQK